MPGVPTRRRQELVPNLALRQVRAPGGFVGFVWCTDSLVDPDKDFTFFLRISFFFKRVEDGLLLILFVYRYFLGGCG